MPFNAPDEELLQADPAPASPNASGGDSGGFSAPAAELLNEQGQTPFDAANGYLHAAADRLPADINPQGDYESEFQKFYPQAKAFHDVNPAVRLGNTLGNTLADAAGHPRQSAADLGSAVKTGVGTLAGKAWQGLKDAGNELATDAEEHPIRLPLDVLTGAAAGTAKGLYGLGKLGVEAIGKGVFDPLVGLDPREGAASEARARRDFALRWYNSNVEAPAFKNVDANINLPATAAVAENVAPYLLPVAGEAAGLSLAGRVAEVAGRVVPRAAVDLAADAGRALELAGKSKLPQAAGGFAGLKAGSTFGHEGALVGGLAGRTIGKRIEGALIDRGQAVQKAAAAAADTLAASGGSDIVRSLARPALAAGESGVIGTGMGLAGAPSGSEAEGAAQGLSLGLAAAPLAGFLAARRPTASGEAPAAAEAAPVEAPATEPAARQAAGADPSSPAAEPPAPLPPPAAATTGDVSPARQDAFTFLTLPKAKGGRGFSPADAAARLAAARDAGVADDAAALIFHAQTGRTPREGGLPLAGLGAAPAEPPPQPALADVPAPAVVSPMQGKALAGVPPVTPARAEAFGALTRGVDGLSAPDANVRLNAAEAAGVRDSAADLLLFARTGQKRASDALAGVR